MSNKVFDSDCLRLPHQACTPDARQRLFVRLDRRTGQSRERTIEDQYEAISCHTLNAAVPETIAAHFETARNLYLYSWFVYRFYSVAEQQVLATLEFSLRERFPDFVAAEVKKHPKGIEPGLKRLLKHAISSGVVSNKNFVARERWAEVRARSRYKHEKMDEMRKAGVESWIENESEIVVTNEDLGFDWLGAFQEIIPTVRNSYAHGSEHLYPTPVLRTFEMVTEIVNQLYPLEK